MSFSKLGATAGIAVLLFLTFVLTANVSPAAESTGRLSSATGPVEIGRGDPPVWQPAREGEELAPGDVVRTGPGGRAAVELRGATARLYENSMIRIPLAPGAVELERGGSLFEVMMRGLRGVFQVQTGEVVVSVKGTRFGVALESGLAVVSVQRGTVGVRSPESAPELEVLVREGFAATGGPDRPFELTMISREDPWDAWEAGAPLPEEIRGLLESASARDPELDAALEAGRGAAADELAELPAEIAPKAERPIDLHGRPEAGRTKAERTDLERSELDPLVDGQLLGSSKPADDAVTSILEASPAARELGTEEISSPLERLGFEIRLHQDHLYVSPGGRLSKKLTEDSLNEVIDGGKPQLLGDDILRALDQRGADPIQFAEDLAELLDQVNQN
jgi:hypothetical protein